MHKELKASRRYAKSLLDLATELKKLDEVEKDMQLISRTYKQNDDLVKMLKSPLIKAEVKNKILSKIFSKNISELTMRFITLIVSKKREGVLPGIARSFTEQVREQRGIVLAEITTAVPLDDKLRAEMKNLVLRLYDKVEVQEHVNPDIIAGFAIKVGDRLYDETIASRINDLKKYYRANPYISKF